MLLARIPVFIFYFLSEFMWQEGYTNRPVRLGGTF